MRSRPRLFGGVPSRLAFDRGAIGMCVVAMDGRFITINAAFARLVGRSQEDLLNLRWDELLPAHDRESRGLLERPSVSDGFAEWEQRFVRPDGQRVDAVLFVSLVKDADNNPLHLFVQAIDVTERKRIDRELASHTALANAVLIAQNELGEGLLILDAATRQPIFVNDALCQMTGYPREELLRLPHLSTLIAPEQRDAIRSRFHARSAGAEVPSRYETALVTKSGEQVEVEVAVQLVETDGQKRLVALCREITERKRGEEALRASNALLEAITAAQSHFIEEAEPRELFEELLGNLLTLTASEYGFIGEVLGRNDGTRYLKTHAISNIEWDEETRAFYEEKAPEGLEFYNLDTLFGAVITTGEAVISNSPERDPRRGGLAAGHPPLHAFLGLPFFAEDRLVGMVGIANRPGGYDEQLADYLQPFLGTCARMICAYQRQRELQEQTRLNEAILRAQSELGDGVAILDLDTTKALFVNEAASVISGYSREELVALPGGLISRLAPEEVPRITGLLQEILRGERDNAHTEAAFLNKNGSRRYLEMAAQLMEIGGATRMVVIGRDLTRQKQLEAQFLHVQKMDAIGRLAGGLAHDVGNLLTSIAGNCELLLAELAPSDPRREDVRAIETAVESGKRLVRQLQSIRQKKRRRPHVVDVNEVVESIQPMLQRAIGPAVHVETSLCPEPCIVAIDRGELEQVVLNLALNAGDAMPDGGTFRLRTERGQSQGEDDVLLRACDDGTGMDKETLERIFEPFFTTKQLDRRSGLGLANVYSIVARSGGWIEVGSELGQGSTFSIYLPRASGVIAAEAR